MDKMNYGYILLFFVGAVAFGVISIWLSRLAGPGRPYTQKNSTYECGEIPVGVAWVQFNISYYIFALIFVIFDVETIFIYPWAVVFQKFLKAGMGSFVMLEMTVFIAILALGLLYAWRKGVLKWV
jgi:NADH-quinone oxidoreductase subunit A